MPTVFSLHSVAVCYRHWIQRKDYASDASCGVDVELKPQVDAQSVCLPHTTVLSVSLSRAADPSVHLSRTADLLHTADLSASLAGQLLETNQRVRELTLQLTSLEDQLSAARLEASKLRTEATTERSSWEIRVHDLQTKINEVRRGRGGALAAGGSGVQVEEVVCGVCLQWSCLC